MFNLTLSLTSDQAIVLWDALYDARQTALDCNDIDTAMDCRVLMDNLDDATDFAAFMSEG